MATSFGDYNLQRGQMISYRDSQKLRDVDDVSRFPELGSVSQEKLRY